MPTQLDIFQHDWLERMEPVVLTAMRGREFTSDDLHSVVEPPCTPNYYGVLINTLNRRKKIEFVDYVKAKRKARNGGVIGRWRVKE